MSQRKRPNRSKPARTKSARPNTSPQRTTTIATPARSDRRSLRWVYGALAVLGVLVAIFLSGRSGNTPSSKAGGYKFAVGTPGPGAAAPAIKLAATDGTSFDLAAARGKTVLLYFEEGVGCEPCWTQIHDIETHFAEFKAAGIDKVVTITGDDLDVLRRKAADEKLTTTVLSDPGLGASQRYHANLYGMMGDSTDGHSFIVVDPQGKIRWRADYGGEPDYTMYVPIKNLLADLRAGLAKNGP